MIRDAYDTFLLFPFTLEQRWLLAGWLVDVIEGEPGWTPFGVLGEA